jgi:hypothetical protein
MHLENFIKSASGKWVMSMLLGLGAATLFREVCKGSAQCEVHRAPSLAELSKTWRPVESTCTQEAVPTYTGLDDDE